MITQNNVPTTNISKMFEEAERDRKLRRFDQMVGKNNEGLADKRMPKNLAGLVTPKLTSKNEA